MASIRKNDYYVGVFLTTILKTAKTVPALFDAIGDAKRVMFDTNEGEFNVYIKYSTGLKEGKDTRDKETKKRKYWNINFTQKEFEYLQNEFPKNQSKNAIALVCTDKDFSSTDIVILSLKDVMERMQVTTEQGNRRITVSRTGKNHRFECFGVDDNYKNPPITVAVSPTKQLQELI